MKPKLFNWFVEGSLSSGTASATAPPALTLLLVNVIPFLGVLLGGWTLLDVVLLYWFENVVIGAVNVLKMAACVPDPDQLRKTMQRLADRTGAKAPALENLQSSGQSPEAGLGAQGAKLFLIPFFTVHYGMFCLVHGVFVLVLLGNGGRGFAGPSPDPLSQILPQLRETLGGFTWVAALLLLGSHLYSFGYHFLFRGEYRRSHPALLMFQPYGRIVVLHVAILFGAFAIMMVGQPMVLLLLLIVGKTALDWRLHAAEHAEPSRRS